MGRSYFLPEPGRGLSTLRLALILLLAGCTAGFALELHYVGPEKCALCHKDVAATQEQTAMATTWQGPLSKWLAPDFDASVSDDLTYEFKRTGELLDYLVRGPEPNTIKQPTTVLMGGQRHGLGFLISIKDVDGIPLARRALVQARYAWSPEKRKLLLAPGCSASKPQSMEAAMGLVLSPTFESRCLGCHGEPSVSAGSGKAGGVHCESCHGPGSEHLTAVSKGGHAVQGGMGIVNPKRLSPDDSIEVCAQCHVGLARFSDPSADDLLVANQVRAIRNSECFLQSGKAFSCTTCHDPHNDAAADSKRSEGVCLGCHAQALKGHAAVCPVNATGECVSCHMPSVEMGPLHLVDHTIRVHPGNGVEHMGEIRVDFKTQVRPISEYLRLISTHDAEAATLARARVSRGESFYSVARDVSVDRSAAIGGFLGRKTLTELGGGLADRAARLGYGETSVAVEMAGRWVILQRLPRDFRWDAELLQTQAEEFARSGDGQGAIKKAQEALMIYPQFLRALSFIGVTFARGGNLKRAAEVLGTATRLDPNDAGAEFALASVLNAKGDVVGARDGFRRVIALEPDFTAAYVSLGMILSSTNDLHGAIYVLRQGLQIDPMSAELYAELSKALTRNGDGAGGEAARKLADKLGGFAVSKGDPVN